jgi:hypothetical protein
MKMSTPFLTMFDRELDRTTTDEQRMLLFLNALESMLELSALPDCPHQVRMCRVLKTLETT